MAVTAHMALRCVGPEQVREGHLRMSSSRVEDSMEETRGAGGNDMLGADSVSAEKTLGPPTGGPVDTPGSGE